MYKPSFQLMMLASDEPVLNLYWFSVQGQQRSSHTSNKPGSNNTAYPINMWNHYDSTLSDDPRTNNFSAGSNNALNTAAGCSSTTLPRLMYILCRFNAEAELTILQTSTGLQTTRKPRNKVIKHNERIRRTVEGYNSANIVTYCRSLGYLHEWTQLIFLVDYIWL